VVSLKLLPRHFAEDKKVKKISVNYKRGWSSQQIGYTYIRYTYLSEAFPLQ